MFNMEGPEIPAPLNPIEITPEDENVPEYYYY